MATPALPTHPGPEHLVTVKVLYNDSNRRFKLPLRDLKAQVFPQKVRESPPELPTGPRARPPISYQDNPLGHLDHTVSLWPLIILLHSSLYYSCSC